MGAHQRGKDAQGYTPTLVSSERLTLWSQVPRRTWGPQSTIPQKEVTAMYPRVIFVTSPRALCSCTGFQRPSGPLGLAQGYLPWASAFSSGNVPHPFLARNEPLVHTIFSQHCHNLTAAGINHADGGLSTRSHLPPRPSRAEMTPSSSLPCCSRLHPDQPPLAVLLLQTRPVQCFLGQFSHLQSHSRAAWRSHQIHPGAEDIYRQAPSYHQRWLILSVTYEVQEFNIPRGRPVARRKAGSWFCHLPSGWCWASDLARCASVYSCVKWA